MSVRCLLGIFFVIEYPTGIYTKEFTVPAQSGKETAFVRVAFTTLKGGEIYYQNAKLDKK